MPTLFVCCYYRISYQNSLLHSDEDVTLMGDDLRIRDASVRDMECSIETKITAKGSPKRYVTVT